MSEENKALVRRFVEEVINGRKLELARRDLRSRIDRPQRIA